ncbi:MAG: hypothetical protein EBR99_08390 [Actinobacteria bacterium]|nr:hypothetical protein [Actinomycetota bacterium]
MTSPECLAATGSPLWLLVAIGLSLVATGLVLWRWPVARAIAVVALLGGATLLLEGHQQDGARAACPPGSSSLISGTFTFVGYAAIAGDLPQLTASNGVSTITATWGPLTWDGNDTNVSFDFPDATAGSWTYAVNQTGATPLEFFDSSLGFSINSSPMLTGGPLDAATTSAVSVASTPVTFTFRVSVGT